MACSRTATARQLYGRALESNGSGTGLSPATHAAALRALLQECSPRSGGDAQSQSAALKQALQLLQTEGAALLGLPGAGQLGGAACTAAVGVSARPAQRSQVLSGPDIQAFAAALAGSGAAEEQAARLLPRLHPAVRLALWGLRLLGTEGTGRQEQQEQLGAAVGALAAAGGTRQLLALLLLAPSWGGPGARPAASHWEAVLRCARCDPAMGIDSLRRPEGGAALPPLALALERLRAAAGPSWAAELSTPAKVRPGAVGYRQCPFILDRRRHRPASALLEGIACGSTACPDSASCCGLGGACMPAVGVRCAGCTLL